MQTSSNSPLRNVTSINAVMDFARNPMREEFWRIPLPSAAVNVSLFLKRVCRDHEVSL
ncbi:hypothetical protein Pla52n_29200 [Stieleria varia]|uniref:Uncharacterized protein n=1 Tax=Stieleria varia TaxID=2528005 RepID=A0A5C6AXX8_9BACT|nr:hypothetical protein Pla52n_29200 [Stieleria varia]